MSVSEMFKMELKNSKNNDYNLLILIKKYMNNGELYLYDLNSKQRAFLHKFAQKYNLDHYSIGNYNNRILVLKDNQHICFDKVYPYKFQDIIEKYSEKQGNQINIDDEEYDEEYDEEDEDEEDSDYEESECEYQSDYSAGTLSKLTFGEK